MKRLVIGVAIAVITAGSVAAQNYLPWISSGSSVQGMVLNCATGNAREAVPCGGPVAPMQAIVTPFMRSGTGDPLIFDNVGTTAKQWQVSKPADATSYRLINPCNVDIRIRKVASLTESVTTTTGTIFLARTTEVFATSQPSFVSVLAMSAPGQTCNIELQYGRGS